MIDTVQNAIRIVTQMFTLMALWLFVLCGQLLTTYYKTAAQKIGRLNRIEGAACWGILSQYRQLIKTCQALHRDFRFILLANCWLSIVTVLTSSFFALEYMKSNHWIVTLWDGSDILESSFRLWLACHTSDRIRSSVCYPSLRVNCFKLWLTHIYLIQAAECIPVIRNLRDRMPSSVERNKVILSHFKHRATSVT